MYVQTFLHLILFKHDHLEPNIYHAALYHICLTILKVFSLFPSVNIKKKDVR